MNTIYEKNETLIKFEINNFHLSKYAKHNARYELYAVCNHDGKNGSRESGHYYSVCKHATKWNEYNDKLVKDFNKDLVSKDAYMLFYGRKNNYLIFNMFKI
jgi:ubiquitin C-terminal hydrolase